MQENNYEDLTIFAVQRGIFGTDTVLETVNMWLVLDSLNTVHTVHTIFPLGRSRN